MRLLEEGSTSPTLLRKVANWDDHPAWLRFRDTYGPRLRRWSRRYGLDEDSIDEVCQRIWFELAKRMRTFEYDPSGSFRGWLRRLCESRVLNLLHERRSASLLSLDDPDGEPGAAACGHARQPVEVSDEDGKREEDAEREGSPDAFRRFLLGSGEQVQAAVKARVKPHNWEAFRLVAVCDWSVEETAQALGMTRVAVYAARKRVADMLRDEGRRVLEQWPSEA